MLNPPYVLLFNGDQSGQACGVGGGRLTMCDFDISWSATASELAISINFDAINEVASPVELLALLAAESLPTVSF